MFIIGALIIAVAATAVSAKTLVGYTAMPAYVKALTVLLILLAWFAPVIISSIRNYNLVGADTFRWISNIGYFLFGTAFILLILILFRDLLWFAFYEGAKLFKSPLSTTFNPLAVKPLAYANLGTVVLAFVVAFYALYVGLKTPAVKEIVLTSPKIKQEYTLVQLSDLHINRAVPVSRLERLVKKVNALDPDVILLTGDIGDDKVESVLPQLDALQDLYAPHGIYAVFGNHEFYNGLMPWQFKFGDLGWTALFNYGVPLKGTELYIGGIPDVSIARGSPFFKIDLDKTVDNSSEEQYKILLSHTPNFQKEMITKDQFDLVLAGHTHGGQIFPFHLLAKPANDNFLAGLYDVNGSQMYVSRGTGYWGPPLRLFAPSEITVFKLLPQK